jgi:hypothetical protein
MDWYDPTCYATDIIDAKYEKVEIDEAINQLDHLTLEQKKTGYSPPPYQLIVSLPIGSAFASSDFDE